MSSLPAMPFLRRRGRIPETIKRAEVARLLEIEYAARVVSGLLAGLEETFAITSDAFRERDARGEFPDVHERAEWGILLDARDRLASLLLGAALTKGEAE